MPSRSAGPKRMGGLTTSTSPSTTVRLRKTVNTVNGVFRINRCRKTVKTGAEKLGWKLMSCSHCQGLCQLAVLASDWLFTAVIQEPACLLTQPLTMTTTHKFLSLVEGSPPPYRPSQPTGNGVFKTNKNGILFCKVIDLGRNG